MNRFGFSEADWEAAKAEVKEILSRRARRPDSQTISYSDLVAQLHSVTLEPHDFRLDHLLGEVASEEAAAGRGMLSVLVVHKHGDLQPGDGFFNLARQLKRSGSDLDIWIAEFRKVIESWSKR
jgi:hypothetical protein